VKHSSPTYLVSSWLVSTLLIACAQSQYLPADERAAIEEAAPCLKFVTFNMRVGAGKEWPFIPLKYLRSSPQKLDNIASVLRELVPNVVALQEVKGEEQARYLATGLNLYWAYVPHGNAEFDWGLALLSEYPIVSYQGRTIYLDDMKPRVALICRLAVEEQTITVVNVHYYPGDYDSQLRQTMDVLADIREPVILMGDLNLITYERQLVPLRDRLLDTCLAVTTAASQEVRTTGTFRFGSTRLDYIFVDPGHFSVNYVGLARKELRGASDHIPYFACLTLKDRRK